MADDITTAQNPLSPYEALVNQAGMNPGLFQRILGAKPPQFNTSGPNAYNEQALVGSPQSDVLNPQVSAWQRLLGANPNLINNAINLYRSTGQIPGMLQANQDQRMFKQKQNQAESIYHNAFNPGDVYNDAQGTALMGADNLLKGGGMSSLAGMTGNQNAALSNTSLNPFISSLIGSGVGTTLSGNSADTSGNVLRQLFNTGAQNGAPRAGATATGSEIAQNLANTSGAQNTNLGNQAAAGMIPGSVKNQYGLANQDMLTKIAQLVNQQAILKQLGSPLESGAPYMGNNGTVQTAPMSRMPVNPILQGSMPGLSSNYAPNYTGPHIGPEDFRAAVGNPGPVAAPTNNVSLSPPVNMPRQQQNPNAGMMPKQPVSLNSQPSNGITTPFGGIDMGALIRHLLPNAVWNRTPADQARIDAEYEKRNPRMK